jgi:hypothetical protein
MPQETSEGFELTMRGPAGPMPPLTVQHNRLVIGSGAHCEVQLPMEHAAVEHVELTIVNGRVYARARVFEPAPTIGGSPFVQTFVEPGVAIGIGPFRIVANPIAVAGGGEQAASTSLFRSPVGVAAILLTVFVLVIAILKKRDAAPAAEVGAPALWSAPTATCPQTAPPQALALATERERVAEGKRERRPFHVQDGVAAVSIFETASACFALGGDADSAAAATRSAQVLRAKVEEDYHAHQVRLQHALLVEDYLVAQREVKVLRAFTETASGPYVVWLSNLDRQLQLEATKDKKT